MDDRLEQIATEEASASGEKVRWTGRPSPRRAALLAAPSVLPGALVVAFTTYWLAGAVGFRWPDLLRGRSTPLALFALPFELIGLWTLLAPLRAWRRARRTIHAVTDRSVRTIVAGRTLRIESHPLPSATEIRRIERPDGSGDLLLGTRAATGTRGTATGAEVALRGIPRVREVEQIVRAAAASARPAAPQVVAATAATTRPGMQARPLAVIVGAGILLALMYVFLRDRPGPRAAPAPAPAPAAKPSGATSPAVARSSAWDSAGDAGLCARGDAMACMRAGFALEKGADAPADPARAAELYARGCELGSGVSCRQLGWMLQDGKELPRDDARAASLHDRGCTLGDVEACNAGGFAIGYGRGVPADPAHAIELLDRSCASGHYPRGCFALGDLLEKRGGTDDRRRALQAYRRSCDAGDWGGCTGKHRLESGG